jgi:hypothetical protein
MSDTASPKLFTLSALIQAYSWGLENERRKDKK